MHMLSTSSSAWRGPRSTLGPVPSVQCKQGVNRERGARSIGIDGSLVIMGGASILFPTPAALPMPSCKQRRSKGLASIHRLRNALFFAATKAQDCVHTLTSGKSGFALQGLDCPPPRLRTCTRESWRAIGHWFHLQSSRLHPVRLVHSR